MSVDFLKARLNDTQRQLATNDQEFAKAKEALQKAQEKAQRLLNNGQKLTLRSHIINELLEEARDAD